MALFIDTDDFKKHAPDIHRNYQWERELKNKVEQITLLRIIPFISQEEYDILETAYHANTLNPTQTLLLTSLQPAIAYFVYLHLLTTNRLQVGAMGVQENRSDDGTSSPASFHAIADVKEETAMMAYNLLDWALYFMEANKSSFAAWTASDSYTELKKCFVDNTKVFNQHVRAGNSRHTFLSIRPEILFIQENELKNEIGETLYNTLLNEFKAGSLTVANAKLIPLIQAWISPQAMMRAIPMNRLWIDGGELMIRSKLDGPERKSAANNDSIRHILSLYETQAVQAKVSLIKFLESNSTEYPDYPNTQHELEDEKTSFKLPNNAHKNSFRIC